MDSKHRTTPNPFDHLQLDQELARNFLLELQQTLKKTHPRLERALINTIKNLTIKMKVPTLTELIILTKQFLRQNNRDIQISTFKNMIDIVFKYTAINSENLLAYAADYMMMPYAIWAQSIADPSDAMNRTAGRDKAMRTWNVFYHEKDTFVPDTHATQFFRMDEDMIIIKAKSPIQEDDKHTMAHFWGYTGFEHGSSFERLTVDDTPIKDKTGMIHAVESYMGTVTLDKSSARAKLIIAFRGSRGGDIGLSLLNTATGSEQKEKKYQHEFTGSNPDWMTDLDKGDYFSFSQQNSFMKTAALFSSSTLEKNIEIHSGIGKAYKSCRPGIKIALQKLLRTGLDDFNGDIIVTGHSLGGGLATLCAYDLRGGFIEEKGSLARGTIPDNLNVQCFTFSAPVVGNNYFKKNFMKKLGHLKSLRSLISQDIITSEPSGSFGFKHVDERFALDEEFRHREKIAKKSLRPPGENFDDLLIIVPSVDAHEPSIVWDLQKRLFKYDLEIQFPLLAKQLDVEQLDLAMPMQYGLPKKSTVSAGQLYALANKDIPQGSNGQFVFISVAKNASPLTQAFLQKFRHEFFNLSALYEKIAVNDKKGVIPLIKPQYQGLFNAHSLLQDAIISAPTRPSPAEIILWSEKMLQLLKNFSTYLNLLKDDFSPVYIEDESICTRAIEVLNNIHLLTNNYQKYLESLMKISNPSRQKTTIKKTDPHDLSLGTSFDTYAQEQKQADKFINLANKFAVNSTISSPQFFENSGIFLRVAIPFDLVNQILFYQYNLEKNLENLQNSLTACEKYATILGLQSKIEPLLLASQQCKIYRIFQETLHEFGKIDKPPPEAKIYFDELKHALAQEFSSAEALQELNENIMEKLTQLFDHLSEKTQDSITKLITKNLEKIAKITQYQAKKSSPS